MQLNKITLIATFFLSLSISAEAANIHREFYARIDSFSWKEFAPNGNELMHESGSLLALGVKNINISNSIKNTSKIEVFGGSPTHHETNGSSRNNYYGFKIETDWSKAGEAGRIEPFVGLGWKRWTRSLDTTSMYTVPGYYGYTENWSSVYGKAGFRKNNGKSFSEIGIKYPLLNNNRIDIIDCSLKPKNALGYYAEIGTDNKNCKFSLRYEYQKYDTSRLNKFGFCQPKSKEQAIGLNVAVKF